MPRSSRRAPLESRQGDFASAQSLKPAVRVSQEERAIIRKRFGDAGEHRFTRSHFDPPSQKRAPIRGFREDVGEPGFQLREAIVELRKNRRSEL